MSVARISRPKLLDAPLRPAQQPVDYGDGYNEFEVDTAAPTVVSGTPTGRRVSRYANVMVTFDDNTYGSN